MGEREQRRMKSARQVKMVIIDSTITNGGPMWRCGPSEKHSLVENIPRGEACPSCGRKLLEG